MVRNGYRGRIYKCNELKIHTIINIRKLGNQGLEVSQMGPGCTELSYGYRVPTEKQEAISKIDIIGHRNPESREKMADKN